MIPPITDADRLRVRELLGREPMGTFAVVVRSDEGEPLVIENAPLLDDGTPMPTRYWLVGASANHAVSVLEADGGVRWAEAVISDDLIADTHRRHATSRDAQIPESHEGPRPTGGVAGTRTGVKCLHAHYACHLAGEDDPVGRWVADRLAEARIDIDATASRITLGGLSGDIPVGTTSINSLLASHDPPHPADLTNAIGLVIDHLDDLILRTQVGRGSVPTLVVDGHLGSALASLEIGRSTDVAVEVDRSTIEELFRLLATDDATGRRDNPGPPPEVIDALLATVTIVVAVMRRLAVETARLGDTIPRSARS